MTSIALKIRKKMENELEAGLKQGFIEILVEAAIIRTVFAALK